MQIDATGSGKPVPFEPRHLGDYLLVAQLGHDALGTVFRAIDTADERRFVRLRVLQSGELDPQAILGAIRGNEKVPEISHPGIVHRARLGVADGVPFLAWHETAGWTLDTILTRLRALKLPISVEHALFVVEQISEALTHTHATLLDGEAVHHGILWPGFVSVSNDADVRIGGFGLAEPVLAAIHKPRMSNEVAPYVAPETREIGVVGDSSDIYSVGVLLLELLTCRRPSLAAPFPDLRAGDPFSHEIAAFLHRCLAAPSERFGSAIEMRAALRELVAHGPSAQSATSFALFLYRLLNPESRNVVPAADAEATNPVPVEAPHLQSSRPGSPPPPPAARAEPEGKRSDSRKPAAPPPRTMKPGGRLISAAALVAIAIAVGVSLRTGSPAPSGQGESLDEKRRGSSGSGQPRESPISPPLRAGEANALLALDVPRRESPRAERKRAARKSETISSPPRSEVRAAYASARSSRFQAGLARVAAERLDARDLAAEIFGQAMETEKEGDQFLREREYDAAQIAFRRAAESFQMAEVASREERVRRVRLDSP